MRLFRKNLRGATALALRGGLLGAGLAGAGFVAPDAAAQTAPQTASLAIDEVVVTSRKREENLQQVPISVSAFTSEGLSRRGLSNVTEISDFVPNVQIDFTSAISGASSSFAAFIRGIGQSDFAINTDPGVGLYIDGVYYARTVGSVVDLLDVERIEVLKGPQGTLFGRNTIGGAINVVTRKPGENFDFRGEVTTGRYNRLDTRGVVDIPLIRDQLYFQVAFSLKNRDGYQRRIPFQGPGAGDAVQNELINRALPNVKDPGNENNDTARAKLLWNASDRVTVNFAFDYARIRENTPASTLLKTTTESDPSALGSLYNTCISVPQGADGFLDAACGPLIGVNADAVSTNDRTPYDSRFVTGDLDTTYATGPGRSEMDSYGGALTVDWEVSDAVSLKSITAYRQLDADFGRDGDGSPLVIDQTSFRINQDQFSQEFQFSGNNLDSRLTWTAGLYYFQEHALQIDFVPLGGGILNIFGPNTQRTKAYAVFGEANFALTEKLSLVAGGRWTREQKRLQLDQQNLSPFFSIILPPEAFPRPGQPNFLGPAALQKANFNNFSPRGGLNYQITEDIFSYFSYSRGFKSGGFTTRLTAPFNPDFAGNIAGGLTDLRFNPEKAEAFEVGVKSEFLNRRLRLNLAGFWTNYNNIQIVVQRGITPANENAAKGRIRGFEAELQALATEAFRITAAFGYMDAQYTRLNPGTPLTLNSKFQNTPEATFSIAGDYTLAMANDGALDLHVDYSYRSSIFNNAENTPELRQGAINLLGASVTYRSPADNWSLSLGGRNLTNERYIVSGFNQPAVGFVEATFSRPREWYFRLQYRY